MTMTLIRVWLKLNFFFIDTFEKKVASRVVIILICLNYCNIEPLVLAKTVG